MLLCIWSVSDFEGIIFSVQCDSVLKGQSMHGHVTGFMIYNLELITEYKCEFNLRTELIVK